MALHDAYLRLTPYELAIPGRAFADERFGAIRHEAKEREVDPSDPARFPLLGEVGRLLQELATSDGPAGRRVQHLGAILYQAFHLWGAGEPVFLMSVPVARALVDARPDAEPPVAPGVPSSSGYLQLPRNLFWARVADDGVPEALDGIFWTAAETLQVLGVLGLRGDRPGMSVVELSGVPLDALGDALGETMREEGADFATDLPGGELEVLYSVQTGGELLKLLGLAFRYVEAHPDSLQPLVRQDQEALGSGDPLPSAIPGSRITPGAGS